MTHLLYRTTLIAGAALLALAVLAADAPAQRAAADGPGTSFSVDVMPGPMGYEASPMIQDELDLDVGTIFSIDLVVDAHDGEEWFAYQNYVNYTDSVLDAINPPMSWANPPTMTTGGNLFPFASGAFCGPNPTTISIYKENDDDADGASWRSDCGESDLDFASTSGGDLIRYFFLCENPGAATLTPAAVADTFLLTPEFASLNDHQHSATINCCPDSDGDNLNDCEEADLGTNPNAVDTDTDGCSDSEELGTVVYAGGLRDPLNHWDFYDVDGDKRSNAIDIGKVRSKVNQNFPPYDRGVGAHPWAPGPPDGIVNAIDIGLVRASVNHYCVDPPN